MQTEAFLTYRERTRCALERYLPDAEVLPESLHQAMRYSALGAGKCVRAMLVYASGHALDVAIAQLDAPASAVELIHAYSLVHDDLPAMDDSALRRGQPTCHRAYSEATAILAGDALQALAFEIIVHDEVIQGMPEQSAKMVQILARASGSMGMAGGQMIDLEAQGKALATSDLEDMHRRKTGALIQASVELGALCAPQASAEQYTALSQYGRQIGLAFQIKDDILDMESDTQTLGKPQGSDTALDKPTYPKVLGLSKAINLMETSCKQALDALNIFDARAEVLRDLAHFIVQREK